MKKKYIIIFSVLVFVTILIYFAVLIISKNSINSTTPLDNNIISEIFSEQTTSTLVVSTSSTQATSTSATSSQESNIANSNQTPVDVEVVNKKVLEYLPKISSEQLSSFSEVASKGDMSGCEKLSSSEIDNCKYYFSFYNNKDGYCGDVENELMKSDCYKKLILENIADKVAVCNKEQAGDFRVNCFGEVFWGNKTVDSCDMFTDSTIYQICADSVNLKIMFSTNKNNCSNIKDAVLKTFCDQYFTLGDFDKDGLSDGEELKIGTNPYLADTDGDGYSDKAEIDKGYNPCGEGLMPAPAKLLEACAALKK